MQTDSLLETWLSNQTSYLKNKENDNCSSLKIRESFATSTLCDIRSSMNLLSENLYKQTLQDLSSTYAGYSNIDLISKDLCEIKYYTCLETDSILKKDVHILKQASLVADWKLHFKRHDSLVESALLNVYLKSDVGEDNQALKIAFDFIEGNFSEGDTQRVDEFLAIFQPERTKRIVSVGIVRSTFRARSVLKEWNNCLARVADILYENNQSPSKYLRGLYPTHGQRLLAKRNAV